MKAFSNSLKEFFATLILIPVWSALGLINAWPIKWAWNYVIPYVFHLPRIEWGHAWCLSFLASFLLKHVRIKAGEEA